MTAFRGSRVATVRLHAQERFLYQLIEHHFANGCLYAAETLDLFRSQPQAWHFQIFGAKTVKEIVKGPHANPSSRIARFMKTQSDDDGSLDAVLLIFLEDSDPARSPMLSERLKEESSTWATWAFMKRASITQMKR